MARYLPITIFHTGIGAVKISWSVFCFLSSAKILMVRIGALNKNKNAPLLNAYAILEYPDKSLKELGSFLSAPVGKSGVNHRLRKISTIAEVLRKGKGKGESE